MSSSHLLLLLSLKYLAVRILCPEKLDWSQQDVDSAHFDLCNLFGVLALNLALISFAAFKVNFKGNPKIKIVGSQMRIWS